ncbi:MAG: ABC transporter ATP-binding protein [Lachnospiraceae bacterium]|nr:ABC transporter ATP-binding protein [Lachnospiraceae bacterium]MDY5742405.1 ABC transporter ATP-binding protein [Lachnospiraceae bacterium]
MLDIQNVTKAYKNTVAVDHISFCVESGKVGILLGPNGAGKSTIIKSIAGLLRFDGNIEICGMPSRDVDAKKIFGYIPEIPTMYDALTVREHMEFINVAYDRRAGAEEIDALLTRFELLDKQDKLGNELSKGMMQKVSICCALLINPKVILLDEPMVGLDPMAIKELREVIGELKDGGTTVLISTHMLNMVEGLWDVVFIMDHGRLLGTYRKEDVGAEELETIFFEAIGRTREEVES